VYAGGAKIASIGIRAEGWIVRHGLSLNVDCDLAAYDEFAACGLDVPFTSVEQQLGRPCRVEEARGPLVERLGEVLELDLSPLPVGAA
jgi:lipoyl(octanoyl) transferase